MTTYPKKILYSPGFGAGWSTWNSEHAQEMCEYQPMIDYLENGGKTVGPEFHQLIEALKAEIGDFYEGGARDLTVETVYGPYRIEEYDGHESVHQASNEIYFH